MTMTYYDTDIIYTKKNLLSLALKGELLECYGFQTGDALPHVKRVPAKS